MGENIEYLEYNGPSVKNELPNNISNKPDNIKVLKGTISEKQGYNLENIYYLGTHDKNEVMKKFLNVNQDVIQHIDEAELKMIVGKNGFEWTKILEQQKNNILQDKNKTKKYYNKIKKFIDYSLKYLK